MKRTIIVIAIGVSTLLSTLVLAGNESANSRLAEASSPANAEAAAVQQRLAHCINSAEKQGFTCKTYVGCSERKSYVASCMNGDETTGRYVSINRAASAAAGGQVGW